jgi:hypothetical protein
MMYSAALITDECLIPAAAAGSGGTGFWGEPTVVSWERRLLQR